MEKKQETQNLSWSIYNESVKIVVCVLDRILNIELHSRFLADLC